MGIFFLFSLAKGLSTLVLDALSLFRTPNSRTTEDDLFSALLFSSHDEVNTRIEMAILT